MNKRSEMAAILYTREDLDASLLFLDTGFQFVVEAGASDLKRLEGQYQRLRRKIKVAQESGDTDIGVSTSKRKRNDNEISRLVESAD